MKQEKKKMKKSEVKVEGETKPSLKVQINQLQKTNGELRQQLADSEKLANNNAYLLAQAEYQKTSWQNKCEKICRDYEIMKNDYEDLLKQQVVESEKHVNMMLNAQTKLNAITMILDSPTQFTTQEVGLLQEKE